MSQLEQEVVLEREQEQELSRMVLARVDAVEKSHRLAVEQALVHAAQIGPGAELGDDELCVDEKMSRCDATFHDPLSSPGTSASTHLLLHGSCQQAEKETKIFNPAQCLGMTMKKTIPSDT